jgi:ribonuclease HI
VLLGLTYVLDHPELGIDVVLTSDSEYIVKGASTWLRVWKMKKWKTTTGLVKNQPVWAAIDELISKLNIEWRWVRGHTGDKWNERADELCTAAYEALLTNQQTAVS